MSRNPFPTTYAPLTPNHPHRTIFSLSLHISPVALPPSLYLFIFVFTSTHSLPPTLIRLLSLSLPHQLTTTIIGGILVGFTGENL